MTLLMLPDSLKRPVMHREGGRQGRGDDAASNALRDMKSGWQTRPKKATTIMPLLLLHRGDSRSTRDPEAERSALCFLFLEESDAERTSWSPPYRPLSCSCPVMW